MGGGFGVSMGLDVFYTWLQGFINTPKNATVRTINCGTLSVTNDKYEHMWSVLFLKKGASLTIVSEAPFIFMT